MSELRKLVSLSAVFTHRSRYEHGRWSRVEQQAPHGDGAAIAQGVQPRKVHRIHFRESYDIFIGGVAPVKSGERPVNVNVTLSPLMLPAAQPMPKPWVVPDGGISCFCKQRSSSSSSYPCVPKLHGTPPRVVPDLR